MGVDGLRNWRTDGPEGHSACDPKARGPHLQAVGSVANRFPKREPAGTRASTLPDDNGLPSDEETLNYQGKYRDVFHLLDFPPEPN